jgi:hypothetical protein
MPASRRRHLKRPSLPGRSSRPLDLDWGVYLQQRGIWLSGRSSAKLVSDSLKLELRLPARLCQF